MLRSSLKTRAQFIALVAFSLVLLAGCTAVQPTMAPDAMGDSAQTEQESTVEQSPDLSTQMAGMMARIEHMQEAEMPMDEAMGEMTTMLAEMPQMMATMSDTDGTGEMMPQMLDMLGMMMGVAHGMMDEMQTMPMDETRLDLMNQMMPMMAQMVTMMAQMQGMMAEPGMAPMMGDTTAMTATMLMHDMNQMMPMMAQMMAMMAQMQGMMVESDMGTMMGDTTPMTSTMPMMGAADTPKAGIPTQNLTQTAELGAITVKVIPIDLAGQDGSLDFEIEFDTHSVELDFDVSNIFTLQAGERELVLATWDSPTSGGHHISGTLTFPATDVGGESILTGVTQVLLTVQMPNSQGTHTFSWEING